MNTAGAVRQAHFPVVSGQILIDDLWSTDALPDLDPAQVDVEDRYDNGGFDGDLHEVGGSGGSGEGSGKQDPHK